MSLKTKGLGFLALVVIAAGALLALPTGLTSIGASSFIAAILLAMIVKETVFS